jgi:hypothetical protein
MPLKNDGVTHIEEVLGMSYVTYKCQGGCGKSACVPWPWGRCCSEECYNRYCAKKSAEIEERRDYAVTERRVREAEWERERKGRRSFKPLYPC